jgi:filamentous hemagglutinin
MQSVSDKLPGGGKPSIHSGKNEVALTSGEKGNWNQTLNKPEPNTVYNVNDRYRYHTDEFGRVEKVEGTLTLQNMDRNTYQQCIAGKCGLAGDEGGHLIASILGGPGEGLNLVPMNGNLNKGEWKKIENEWVQALKEGKKVQVKIEPTYLLNNKRPDNFTIVYQIENLPLQSKSLLNSPRGK